MTAGRFAAVDLGASSGRVVLGDVAPDRLALTEVHRFPNRPVRLPSGLHWDLVGLYGNVLDGLAAAARSGPVDGIGVDTWAVDYGLLDRTGALLGEPYCYRDSRTDGVVRGSGIFAGGLGASRAAVYGVPEEKLGEFYAQRTLLKREVLPDHVADAVFALTGGDLTRTTGLHVPVDSGVAAAFLR